MCGTASFIAASSIRTGEEIGPIDRRCADQGRGDFLDGVFNEAGLLARRLRLSSELILKRGLLGTLLSVGSTGSGRLIFACMAS